MADDEQIADQEPLPGLDFGVQPGASKLEESVALSFERMRRDGLADERHAGLLQLGLVLARRIGSGRYAKDYGIAQLSAQLVAIYAQLLPDEEGGGGDAFDELQRRLRELDETGGAAPVGHPG